MNYYQQAQHNVWHREQLAAFKKSDNFLHSEAFALEGQKTLIWLGNDGSVRMDAAKVPEKFPNAIIAWEGWQQKNYSEKAEYIYNTWMDKQKASFKETPEYKNSKLVENIRIGGPLECNGKIEDGIEIYENGTVELAFGEKFENAVTPLNEFKPENHYELMKMTTWDIEQTERFHNSDNFKNSESFKNECFLGDIKLDDSNIDVFVGINGSVTLNPEAEMEVFPNAVTSFDDWKKENYSETEEIAYNQMMEEKVKMYPEPDKIFLKEEKEIEQVESEECCMSM